LPSLIALEERALAGIEAASPQCLVESNS